MYFALKILENIYNYANVPIFSFEISSITTALDAWFLRTNGAKKIKYDSLYSTRDLWSLNLQKHFKKVMFSQYSQKKKLVFGYYSR